MVPVSSTGVPAFPLIIDLCELKMRNYLESSSTIRTNTNNTLIVTIDLIAKRAIISDSGRSSLNAMFCLYSLASLFFVYCFFALANSLLLSDIFSSYKVIYTFLTFVQIFESGT